MEQRQIQEGKNLFENYSKDPRKQALIERWAKWMPTQDKYGKNMKMNYHNQYCMAQLFENQLGELKAFKSKHVLGEDTTTSNTAPFIKYTFPILRRMWPALIAPEIVSVQPMSAPVGAIFYFELKYGSNKGAVTKGDKLIKDFNRNYSSDLIDGEIYLTTSGGGANLNGTLAFVPVIAGSVSISVTGVSGTITDDGLGALTGTADLALSAGTIDYTTGAIVATLVTPVGNGKSSVATYKYNMEGNSLVPQVDVDIALVSVTAKTRKLKALWSSEASDDLKALHGLDAEAEIVSGLGSEIALELDRELIEDMRAGGTGGQATFDMTVPTGVNQIDHYVSMLTPLTLLANQIGKNTLRGPANFIVMSYDLAAHVEQIGNHAFYRPVFAGDKEALAPAEAPQMWGIMKMGTIQNRFFAYKDPFLKANEAVVGFKGANFIDAGMVWAPYVPLQITATFLDPNDFKYRKGLRTRYAKLLARGEFYGKLTVSNLNTITPGTFGPVL